MSEKIFNLHGNGRLVEMESKKFDSEDIFQSLLEDHPSLLAGDQIDPKHPRRWLLVKREMGVRSEEGTANRWSIDHLFLDQDAVPTLVEVKRSSDTRIRREVVGQMLDYAANSVAYWNIADLINAFEKQCTENGNDPEEQLNALLGEEGDAEEYWKKVKTNLQVGRLRMLFVADEIPTELQQIIEFLNVQMDPAEVLGVQINHYVGQEMRTLVPRVIGKTAEAETRKRAGTSSKPPVLSREEMQALAVERGVGSVYETLVARLSPIFFSMKTTHSNIAFYGKTSDVETEGVIWTLIPRTSTAEQGLRFQIIVRRLVEFFQLDKAEVVTLLPNYDANTRVSDRVGDIYNSYTHDPAPLLKLIDMCAPQQK